MFQVAFGLSLTLCCYAILLFIGEHIFSKRFLFLKILFIFRERGREGEREGEKHQCVVASCMPPIGDLACNPGMCPDWESNQWPFGSQAHAQSMELHQPRQSLRVFEKLIKLKWISFLHNPFVITPNKMIKYLKRKYFELNYIKILL